MKKVSVIIPTYNEEKVIGECLVSLDKQTYSNFEVIVVDDGSTDSSKLKVKDSKLKNLKLFEQKHKGAGAARNLGAKSAKGEILVFVDADMSFDRDFIKNLAKPINENKSIGTFSKDEYLANKDNVWARCWNMNRGFMSNKMFPENYPDTQKVFRAILKSEFEKAGGFNEKGGYTDDWSISERLGVEATVAPNAVFYHRNPDNLVEIFTQSKWMAKRKYKLGLIGFLVALLRFSLPVSLGKAIVGMIKFKTPEFFVFKLVSDFGQFLGIIEFMFGKVSK